MIRARQLADASLSLGAVTVWLALLGLVTTPYLIHHLGAAFYGVFALITIMSAYLSNLELGFGHATVRFLARARAADDVETERAVLGTSLTVFLMAGSAGGLMMLGFASFIVRTFVHGSAALHHQAIGAVRIGALILALALVTSFASASLQAFGRLQLLVATRAGFGTLASVSAVVLVAAGGGLRTVLVGQAVITATLCAFLCSVLSRAARVPLRPRVSLRTLRAMAAFGGLVLVAGLAYQTMLQGPPLVLAGHAATSQVAAFAVPNLVLQQLVTLATATSLGFFPFVSAESGGSDRRRLADVYRANLRLTLLVMAPIAAYLAIYGFPLLATWISRPFADDAIGPLRYLAVAGVALALSAAPADVARGLGRPGWVAGFTGAAAALALGGSFSVVSRYGATGVAGALCGALVCATVTFAILVGRHLLALPAGALLRALMRPFVAVSLCVALFALGHLAWGGFAGAVVVGPVALLAYLTAAVALVLDDRERAALGRVVPASLRTRWQTQS